MFLPSLIESDSRSVICIELRGRGETRGSRIRERRGRREDTLEWRFFALRQLVHLEAIVTGVTRIFRIICGELVRKRRESRSDRANPFSRTANCASVCYFGARYPAIRSPSAPLSVESS